MDDEDTRDSMSSRSAKSGGTEGAASDSATSSMADDLMPKCSARFEEARTRVHESWS